jgi:hypothetical protein
VLAADTYTSVLMTMHFRVAEATARLVLTAATKKGAGPATGGHARGAST